MKTAYRKKLAKSTTPNMVLSTDLPEQSVREDAGYAFLLLDEATYTKLYEQFFPELYNYGVKLCSDPDFTKDCIHDLFIDLWKKRKKRLPVTSTKAYLFRALRNIILKAQNRRPRFQSVNLTYSFDTEASPEMAIINEQADQAQQQQLYEAINTLTQQQREIVFLKFYSQLTYEEAASVLGISTKATYKLMARAIDVLRQKMIPLAWWGMIFSSLPRF